MSGDLTIGPWYQDGKQGFIVMSIEDTFIDMEQTKKIIEFLMKYGDDRILTMKGEEVKERITEEYTDEMKCIDDAIESIEGISTILESCRRDVGKTGCAFRLRTARNLIEIVWDDIYTAYRLESNKELRE